MAMTVAPKPATPEPAAASKTTPASAAKTEAPATKAPADKFKETAPKKEAPVTLQAMPRAGEEIPTATDSSVSAADFVAAGEVVGGPGSKDPKIDPGAGQGAKYEPVKGTPFIQGAGDGADVHWNDIDQGGLGDCYFMSAMGSVAQQDPAIIRNAIKDNGNGSYTVRFYDNQKPVDVTVSGDFPMKNGQPVFAGMPDSNGDQRELWPAIMEKAFAQYKGSYEAIGKGGSPANAMELLTGKESQTQSASSITIDQLDTLFKGGNALVVSTLPKGDKKDAYANGTLVANHAYMITGVDKDAGTVTLRNPWGSHLPDVKLSIADFNKNLSTVSSNVGN